jgi:hypothetical protein
VKYLVQPIFQASEQERQGFSEMMDGGGRMSSEQHWLVQTIYDTSLDWDKNDLFLENQVFGKRNGKKQSRGLPGIYGI